MSEEYGKVSDDELKAALSIAIDEAFELEEIMMSGKLESTFAAAMDYHSKITPIRERVYAIQQEIKHRSSGGAA